MTRSGVARYLAIFPVVAVVATPTRAQATGGADDTTTRPAVVSVVYDGTGFSEVAGGLRNGEVSLGTLNVALSVDGARLFHVPGLSAYADVVWIHGGRPDAFPGDAQGVSNLTGPAAVRVATISNNEDELLSRLIPHRHRTRAELPPAHEPQVEALRQPREQCRSVAHHPGLHHELVLIDQSELGLRQRELHASHEQSLTRLPLQLPDGLPQIPAHELRVPIDPVQGTRHDVLLCRADRPGEGFHPIGPRSCRRRHPPRCLHHFVGHPAEEEGIGLLRFSTA